MARVVLIPGNMCDERLWLPVAEVLEAGGHRALHAPRMTQDSIAAMARSLHGLLETPAVLVGFSMGAIIAAEAARQAPGQVEGLGLVAFNASADLPERAAVRPGQQARVRAGELETIVADELKPNYLAAANRTDPALRETVMMMAQALGPEVFVAQSEALRQRGDLRPALAGFAMPVLLACGTEDRLCPPQWHREWAGMIGTHACFVEVPGAGHLLPLEQPMALAEALLGWLQQEA